MNKNEFSTISKNFKNLINEIECFNNAFKIENVLTISQKDFDNFIKKTSELMSKSDKVLHAELYHLFGMGNLSGSQMSIIAAYAAKLSNARVRIKEIFGAQQSLKQTRALLRKSASFTYKMDVLGKTLTQVSTNSPAI